MRRKRKNAACQVDPLDSRGYGAGARDGESVGADGVEIDMEHGGVDEARLYDFGVDDIEKLGIRSHADRYCGETIASLVPLVFVCVLRKHAIDCMRQHDVSEEVVDEKSKWLRQKRSNMHDPSKG